MPNGRFCNSAENILQKKFDKLAITEDELRELAAIKAKTREKKSCSKTIYVWGKPIAVSMFEYSNFCEPLGF